MGLEWSGLVSDGKAAILCKSLLWKLSIQFSRSHKETSYLPPWLPENQQLRLYQKC